MNPLKALLILAAVVYPLTGLYFVQPDEEAIVCRFGAVTGLPREPGAHFGLPWGLDRIERVKPREAKRITIGLPEVTDGTLGSGGAQFLTGDRNLVNIQATVQYSIRTPRQYLFRTASVDSLIARAAESMLATSVAAEPVDRVLTEGKRELSNRVAEGLRKIVEDYQLGITIRSVDIGTAEPPPEVADAFDDVVSALRQSEQTVNQAVGYSDKIQAEARGEASQLVDLGKTYRDSVIQEADGETTRFESLLVEYRRAPELTRTRLYLETMSEILPRFRSKLFLDPDSNVDLSIIREKVTENGTEKD